MGRQSPTTFLADAGVGREKPALCVVTKVLGSIKTYTTRLDPKIAALGAYSWFQKPTETKR